MKDMDDEDWFDFLVQARHCHRQIAEDCIRMDDIDYHRGLEETKKIQIIYLLPQHFFI